MVSQAYTKKKKNVQIRSRLFDLETLSFGPLFHLIISPYSSLSRKFTFPNLSCSLSPRHHLASCLSLFGMYFSSSTYLCSFSSQVFFLFCFLFLIITSSSQRLSWSQDTIARLGQMLLYLIFYLLNNICSMFAYHILYYIVNFSRALEF